MTSSAGTANNGMSSFTENLVKNFKRMINGFSVSV